MPFVTRCMGASHLSVAIGLDGSPMPPRNKLKNLQMFQPGIGEPFNPRLAILMQLRPAHYVAIRSIQIL